MDGKNKSPFGPWIVVLAILPVIVGSALVGLGKVLELVRYDQKYFTAEYQERFPSPGAAALAMEQALHTGDLDVLAGLQGLRSDPAAFEANPNLYALLYDADENGYFYYLYYDPRTFYREFHAFKQVGGRWVLIPEDLYYYLDSGHWLESFAPLASAYYAILIVVVLGLGIFRLAARFRKSVFRL